MMLTLVGDQAQAMERLNDIGTNNVDALPIMWALQARNTGDYRPLDKLGGLSPVECVEWFSAWAGYVDTSIAWTKLNENQKRTIDFIA